MRKFEKAKKETVEKMEQILELLLEDNTYKACKIFEKICGFCNIYRFKSGVFLENRCDKCPLFITEKAMCCETVWHADIESALWSDASTSIPLILALKGWIEELKEPANDNT